MLRLQTVQNHIAKVVFRKSRHENVRPLRKVHHWLPVKERIIIKMATFVFHFFASTLPPYCHHVFSVYIPFRTLRSSSDGKTTTTITTTTRSYAKWKLEGFGYGCSLSRLPCLEQPTHGERDSSVVRAPDS